MQLNELSITIFNNMKQIIKKEDKRPMVSFLCPVALRERLDAYVEKEQPYSNIKRSDVINQALREHLEKIGA
jgi:hypothetical protein